MTKHSLPVTACAVGLALALSVVRSSFAQVGPDGIDWVTVGAVNNPAYDGPDPFGRVGGRGSVGYEYKIGRTETTTALWVEFVNTFKARADPVSDLILPPFLIRGAERDPDYHGPGERLRVRTDLPNAAMIPVGGFDWRTAARLVNWLNNDKSSAHSAIENGAYDTRTFGQANGTWTDQVAHNPGARYWIPTLDEWIKAVHFDPNANGGAGRWWSQPNGSDTPLVYGPPPGFPGGSPLNQANAGFLLPNFGEELIPLGSYTTVTPWGLLDAAGGTREFLETVVMRNGRRQRAFHGTGFNDTPEGDRLFDVGGIETPGDYVGLGFRIASSVPSAGATVPCALFLAYRLVGRKRKGDGHESGPSINDLGVGVRSHGIVLWAGRSSLDR